MPHRPKRHTGLNTAQDYYFKGPFCRRFIRDIEPLYALLPHRSISSKDTRVKRKDIARLICHKGLSSKQDYCMLYGHTSLYKALTRHKGETKSEHVTCHTGLIATQVLSPPRTIRSIFLQVYSSYKTITCTITTQDYFIKKYKGQKKNYCTPHVPQRTIFHTGLLYALRSHRSYKALTSHKGENKPKHNRNYSRHENRGETNCDDQIEVNTAKKTTKEKKTTRKLKPTETG